MSWVWRQYSNCAAADVERAAGDLAEPHVLPADLELAGREAHRRRAVAAAAGLVEHQGPMLAPELFHHRRRGVGDEHAFDHWRALRDVTDRRERVALLRAARRRPSGAPGRGHRPRPADTATGSEEAERLGRVADQQVLGLLIVVEHHLVGFAPDARLLVAAERRMGGIGVVAVDPDAARRGCRGPCDSSAVRSGSIRPRRGRRACRWRWRALRLRP